MMPDVVSLWRVYNIAVEKKARLNEEITVPTIRLIGKDREQIGIVALAEALGMAEKVDLDLVEIVPTAEPPVCRIMDYGKFIFEQGKKKHASKKKQKQIKIKEVKIRPATEEGDYQIKLRNMMRFLEQGDKVKITLRFRGREMAHQELGIKMLDRIRNDTESCSTVEQMPKIEGRQMIMLIASKR